MILADLAAEFNPSTAFAPTTATPADLAELSADLGGFDAIPDDSPLWDEFAAEAECRDLMEAGVATL